jgi:hypothetical protein
VTFTAIKCAAVVLEGSAYNSQHTEGTIQKAVTDRIFHESPGYFEFGVRCHGQKSAVQRHITGPRTRSTQVTLTKRPEDDLGIKNESCVRRPIVHSFKLYFCLAIYTLLHILFQDDTNSLSVRHTHTLSLTLHYDVTSIFPQLFYARIHMKYSWPCVIKTY